MSAEVELGAKKSDKAACCEGCQSREAVFGKVLLFEDVDLNIEPVRPARKRHYSENNADRNSTCFPELFDRGFHLIGIGFVIWRSSSKRVCFLLQLRSSS